MARDVRTRRDRGPGIRRAAATSEEEDEAETDDRRTHRGRVPAGVAQESAAWDVDPVKISGIDTEGDPEWCVDPLCCWWCW